MSTDNWALCPQCEAIADKEWKEKVEQVGKWYGKVTAEEYLKLFESIKGAKPVLQESLCEYYYTGISKSKFSTSYCGKCDECGFKYEFRHEDRILIDIAGFVKPPKKVGR